MPSKLSCVAHETDVFECLCVKTHAIYVEAEHGAEGGSIQKIT